MQPREPLKTVDGMNVFSQRPSMASSLDAWSTVTVAETALGHLRTSTEEKAQ